MEILTNLRDDSLNRVIDGLSHLIACAKTIKHEEENIRRFSEHMICVREIINMLQSMQSRGQFSHNNTAAQLLLKLEIAVNDARKAIEGYKSKGPLLYIFYSSSVFSKLNESSKEIANVLILLSQTQILTAVDINSNLDAIIHSLKSMELKFVENNNAIYSKLDQYISENMGNPQHTDQGLFQHPRAEGTTSSKSVEMESGKSINKAYQFIQRLACFSPEMSSSTQRESTVDEIASAPNIFFYCPLTMKPMEDPVTVSCNHSYERKAIEEYFRSGKKTCLLCEKELVSSTSGDLELTPNPTLLGSISEWKLRNARISAEKNAKKKLRDAAARINLDNMESTNRALNDLMAVMNEMPSCISEATESSCKLVRKLAELLKNGAGNTDWVLSCLLLIARFSRENKEIIGTGGVIKCLLKLSKFEPIVVEILLELSRNDNFAQKVSNIPIFIPIMVSLLDNPDSCLVENVLAVLKNISHSYNNTIFMAKAGYFTPFLDEFNAQGTSEERRAFMAEKLAQMQLMETVANNLNNEHFIIHLGAMLLCNSPRSQLASLKCIKRLITFNGIRISFLSTVSTITALLCILTDTTSEQQFKKEAFDVLFSLIETRQPLNQQSYPGLQRLYSSYTIHNLLEQIQDSTPNDQLSLLRLLLALFQKSDTTRDEIISVQKAMSHLFSAVRLNVNGKVRFNALKLVCCITRNHPSDIPLPPPDKKTTLSSIINILTDQSCIDEEVSIAANLISHLPRDDKSIDELQSSIVLKAIHSLISHANKKPNDFSENALGALLKCINKSNSGFLVPVSKLEPLLVQMLSTGANPLVKQRAAMILAYLAQCAPDSSHSRRPSWSNLSSTHCAVHEACSLQRITCLIKAGAVGPLVDMVDIINPDASKEALIALDTLFDTGNMEPSASQYLVDKVADIIVENKGATPILEVLERGLLPLKKVALELFGKIYKRPGITRKELDRYKAILVYQHNEDDEFKQKVKTQLEELEFHSRLCL